MYHNYAASSKQSMGWYQLLCLNSESNPTPQGVENVPEASNSKNEFTGEPPGMVYVDENPRRNDMMYPGLFLPIDYFSTSPNSENSNMACCKTPGGPRYMEKSELPLPAPKLDMNIKVKVTTGEEAIQILGEIAEEKYIGFNDFWLNPLNYAPTSEKPDRLPPIINPHDYICRDENSEPRFLKSFAEMRRVSAMIQEEKEMAKLESQSSVKSENQIDQIDDQIDQIVKDTVGIESDGVNVPKITSHGDVSTVQPDSMKSLSDMFKSLDITNVPEFKPYSPSLIDFPPLEAPNAPKKPDQPVQKPEFSDQSITYSDITSSSTSLIPHPLTSSASSYASSKKHGTDSAIKARQRKKATGCPSAMYIHRNAREF